MHINIEQTITRMLASAPMLCVGPVQKYSHKRCESKLAVIVQANLDPSPSHVYAPHRSSLHVSYARKINVLGLTQGTTRVKNLAHSHLRDYVKSSSLKPFDYLYQVFSSG